MGSSAITASCVDCSVIATVYSVSDATTDKEKKASEVAKAVSKESEKPKAFPKTSEKPKAFPKTLHHLPPRTSSLSGKLLRRAEHWTR